MAQQEATIQKLNDELRDTENELNILKHVPKVNPEDQLRIAELQAALSQKESEHTSVVSELRE